MEVVAALLPTDSVGDTKNSILSEDVAVRSVSCVGLGVGEGLTASVEVRRTVGAALDDSISSVVVAGKVVDEKALKVSVEELVSPTELRVGEGLANSTKDVETMAGMLVISMTAVDTSRTGSVVGAASIEVGRFVLSVRVSITVAETFEGRDDSTDGGVALACTADVVTTTLAISTPELTGTVLVASISIIEVIGTAIAVSISVTGAVVNVLVATTSAGGVVETALVASVSGGVVGTVLVTSTSVADVGTGEVIGVGEVIGTVLVASTSIAEVVGTVLVASINSVADVGTSELVGTEPVVSTCTAEVVGTGEVNATALVASTSITNVRTVLVTDVGNGEDVGTVLVVSTSITDVVSTVTSTSIGDVGTALVASISAVDVGVSEVVGMVLVA